MKTLKECIDKAKALGVVNGEITEQEYAYETLNSADKLMGLTSMGCPCDVRYWALMSIELSKKLVMGGV